MSCPWSAQCKSQCFDCAGHLLGYSPLHVCSKRTVGDTLEACLDHLNDMLSWTETVNNYITISMYLGQAHTDGL